MEPTYTPLQGQYLAFIHHYTILNGCAVGGGYEDASFA